VVIEGFQKIVAGQQVKPVDKTPPHETAEAMPHDVDEVAEAEAKVAEAKMAEAKAAEARAAEAKASAAKAGAIKASDGKTSDGKAEAAAKTR
jgi:hypothetical protein